MELEKAVRCDLDPAVRFPRQRHVCGAPLNTPLSVANSARQRRASARRSSPGAAMLTDHSASVRIGALGAATVMRVAAAWPAEKGVTLRDNFVRRTAVVSGACQRRCAAAVISSRSHPCVLCKRVLRLDDLLRGRIDRALILSGEMSGKLEELGLRIQAYAA